MAVSAEEWIGGKDADPVLEAMKDPSKTTEDNGNDDNPELLFISVESD